MFATIGAFVVVVLLAGLIVADDDTTVDGSSGSATNTRATTDDVRTVDLGTFGPGQSIPVALGDGDISFLLTAIADDPDEPLTVTKVRDPTGDEIYAAGAASESASGGLTAHVRQSLVATGEVSLMAPAHPGLDIRAGTYEVEIDNIAPVDAAVVIKAAADVDEGRQAIDLNVWSASSAFDNAALEAGLRTGMDTVLNPQELEVGTITVITAPPDEVEEHGDADLERLEEVCEAAGTDIGYERALNLALVDNLSDDLAGVASGLPGAVEDPDAKSTCVVAATGLGSQTIPMANIASAVVHEASHFMGLTHTTEEDGAAHDDFTDTPECDLDTYDGRDNVGYPGDEDGSITAEECGLEGAADNYMFFEDPYPDVRDVLTQQVMSADQAWALRRHPLFYPVT